MTPRMTPAAMAVPRTPAPRRRTAAGWAAGLLVLLALTLILVRLDAIDPLVGSVAMGMGAWLAWAARRFARTPLLAPRTAARHRRWLRAGVR